MSVVRLRVEVFEDDQPVGTLEIGYFPTQEYVVLINTADGTDAMLPRRAGEPAKAGAGSPA